MKKKMILLFIFVLTVFVGFNRVGAISIQDYTSSGSGVSGFGGEGDWNPISGFRVVILDENGNKVAGTERINVTNGKVIEEGILQYVPSSKSNYGKTNYKTVKITTNSYSKVEYIKKGVVNSRTNFTEAISKSNVYYWADITGLEEFGNYLNNKDVIKVDGVDSYLEKNNYKNLKLMMEAAKYTCFSNKPNQQQCKDAENHYVSVEPLTLIYRDLGTAFELGGRPWLVGGECTKNSGCWYGDVYLNMHNSLLINQNKDFFDAIKGGNSTLAVKQENEAYKRINSNRGVGMGLYKITDIGTPTPTKGYLKIIKENNYGGSASGNFIVYQGKGCNTGSRKEFNGTITKEKTLTLIPGWYSITEVSAPSIYVQPENNCIDVDVKEAQTATRSFTNTLQCHEAVTYIKQNFSGEEKKRQLIDLYNKEGNSRLTNLLNFDNPSCFPASCSPATKDGDECLSAEFKPNTNFGPDNYSCFTNSINVDGKTAFCQTGLVVDSYVGNGPFKATAGQMYINSSTGKAVKSTLSMKCYLLDSAKSSFTVDYKDYIETIKFDNEDLFFNNTSIKLDKVGVSNLYQKTVNVDYYFKKIYSNNITGEVENAKYNETVSPCSGCKFLGYGKISKLTDNYKNKQIPFAFALQLEETYDFNGFCEVTATPEIIMKNKPALVFRTVNTQVTDGKDSFLGKDGNVRSAKTNWLGNESIIATNNNSYNKNGAGAKYTITLTPSDIKTIRKYNKKTSYDDYTLYCDSDGNNCKSRFLDGLQSGTLKFYNTKTNKVDGSWIIQNKLNINESI